MQQQSSYILSIDALKSLPFVPRRGDRIFLRGELGAGKTTLARQIISTFLDKEVSVKSPTYIYYNCYGDTETPLYHFDLYRLWDYNEFVNIAGEEILDDANNICFIEWPELLTRHYNPTVDILILKTEDENAREIIITTY